MGGAIFVQQGGNFIVAGNLSLNENSVTGGAGGFGTGANGSAFGSGIFLQGNGTITFQPTAGETATISDVIADQTGSGGTGTNAGSWNLTKSGTGALVLSSKNNYTGTTTVNGGTLQVDGSIASSSLTMVNVGGTLGGNGTIGNTTVNGGMLAPIGTLTVRGNLVFTAASSYTVEVSPWNANRTNVIGTAALSGAKVNASFALGSYVARQYPIVNATGGVTGKFGSLVNTNLPSGFKSTLSYDANDAYLTLVVDFGSLAGLNVNQQNVGNALTNFFNVNGGIPVVFGTLTPAGLSQVSGENATATRR